MNEIILNDVKYTAPARWEEVSEKLFLAWAAASLKKMSLADNIRLLIKVFYKIPLSIYLRLPESARIQIAPTISFLYSGDLPVNWIIKKLRFWLRNDLYGPDDRLANCTINEFRYALLFYQAYQKSGNETYLDQLIATLYRPKRKGEISNDIRIPITDFSLSERASRVSKLPRKIRHAILLNFEGCYQLIRTKYLDKLPKSDGQSTGLFDLNSIILSVAGGKFGTKGETEQAMLYDFLEHLVSTAEEVERIKNRK